MSKSLYAIAVVFVAAAVFALTIALLIVLLQNRADPDPTHQRKFGASISAGEKKAEVTAELSGSAEAQKPITRLVATNEAPAVLSTNGVGGKSLTTNSFRN